MEEAQIIASEKINQGSAWTNNKQFDSDGYYVIKDLWDVEELYHPLPSERGMLRYWGKEPDQFEHNQLEEQVNGSLSRYNHPQYRRIHSKIGEKIEKVIGRRLYTTYFYGYKHYCCKRRCGVRASYFFSILALVYSIHNIISLFFLMKF